MGHHSQLRRLLAIGFLAAFVSACASHPTESAFYPAPTSELDLHIIGQQRATPVQASELGAFLSSAWSDPLTLVSEPATDSTLSISTCEELLEKLHKNQDLQAANPADRPAFLYRTNICLAVDALSKAKPSRITHVRSLPLDASATEVLPSELAFATSHEYTKRLKQYRGKPLSAVFLQEDGFGLAGIEAVSAHRILIHDAADGRQELAILGYGDLNEDGIEDLLLMVQNTINGASYYSSLLYALTGNGNGPLQLLRRFPLPGSEENEGG